jgi:quercetin dioxygenase-like cupin family protein
VLPKPSSLDAMMAAAAVSDKKKPSVVLRPFFEYHGALFDYFSIVSLGLAIWLPLRHEFQRRLGLRGPWATNERSIMKYKKLMLVLLCLMTGTLLAQQPKVTPLMSKDLTDIPGREVLMITVEYAPGGADPIHRHNAQGFIYVLEGSVVMQVKGGKQVTLTPGQTFYEGPDDVHVVGRNASSTKPAKFLVFLVKDKGAPVLVPVPE